MRRAGNRLIFGILFIVCITIRRGFRKLRLELWFLLVLRFEQVLIARGLEAICAHNLAC